MSDILDAGLTKGCEGCVAINRGQGGIKGSAKHNDTCRNHVEAYLRAKGDTRLDKAESRILKRLEETVEKHAIATNDQPPNAKRTRINEPPQQTQTPASSSTDVPMQSRASSSNDIPTESRKSKRAITGDDLDEEERGGKFQQLPAEIDPDKDTNMAAIMEVWVCEFSINQHDVVNRNQLLQEIARGKIIGELYDDKSNH